MSNQGVGHVRQMPLESGLLDRTCTVKAGKIE
jgi:hypothetical protein